MRRARAWAAVALFLAACPARRFDQRDWARVLRPAPIATRLSADRAGLSVLTVRAYASPEYRSHDPAWRERIGDQVRRASAVVEEQFAVRLELESVRPWERRHEDAGLRSAAEALRALDPAAEVDWVVGFVGASPESPSTVYDRIGLARAFGRHFVLRAMQSRRDLARIDSWYDQLPEADRAAIAREEREHRETAMFLHEWAHTLGAVHECDGKWFMSERYQLVSAEFSPESARLARVGLRWRDGAGREAWAMWAREWRFEARVMAGVSWECATLERELAETDAWLARTLAGRGPWGEYPLTAGGRRARYAADVLRALDATLPRGAVPASAGAVREVRSLVEVRIGSAGDLAGVRVLASSGDEALDRTAADLVVAAKAVPPPPRDVADTNGGVALVLGVWSSR
jgi:TonB family protein